MITLACPDQLAACQADGVCEVELREGLALGEEPENQSSPLTRTLVACVDSAFATGSIDLTPVCGGDACCECAMLCDEEADCMACYDAGGPCDFGPMDWGSMGECDACLMGCAEPAIFGAPSGPAPSMSCVPANECSGGGLPPDIAFGRPFLALGERALRAPAVGGAGSDWCAEL